MIVSLKEGAKSEAESLEITTVSSLSSCPTQAMTIRVSEVWRIIHQLWRSRQKSRRSVRLNQKWSTRVTSICHRVTWFLR